MNFADSDDKKIIILRYKDEIIDKCVDYDNILKLANNPDLKDEIDDCFTHRLFSH